MVDLSRRSALFGLLAAPAIVRAESLMRIKPQAEWTQHGLFTGRYLRIRLPNNYIVQSYQPIVLTGGPVENAVSLFRRANEKFAELEQQRQIEYKFMDGTQWS